jgi:hypothetical protein
MSNQTENILWYQEHDRRKLQETVSDNVHHGQQLHTGLLLLNLGRNVEPQHVKVKKEKENV